MSYTPRAGSVAYRAIEHLRQAGTDVAIRPLSEAADTDPDTIRVALMTALDQGVVSKTRRNGLAWYRIGDGVPPNRDRDEDEPDTEAAPAGPARNGSQTPDDAAAIPGARAGSETPQQGANRDASTGQSHGAGGSESPAGRGTDGASALGAAPVFLQYETPAQIIDEAATADARYEAVVRHALAMRKVRAEDPARLPPVGWLSQNGDLEIRRGDVVTERFTRAELVAHVAWLAEVQVREVTA